MKIKAPLILCSGLTFLFCACNGKETKSEQNLLIHTTTATVPSQKNSKEFPFIARPFRSSELSFRVSGPVNGFDVYAGNHYKQGSTIAEIDPRDFHIRKERAEAIYRQAKTEFERIEALYQKENISASTYEKAKADYASAKTAFETATNELEDTRLTAPFSGYIGEVYIEKYQDVKAAQPVLSLIDIHQLRIEIYVPQDIAYAAQSLDSIRLHFDVFPTQTYQASIVDISKGTTRNNLSYLLTAMLPNENGSLLAGMSGKAILDIPQVENDAQLCIPQTALCHRPSEGDYVWVFNPGTSQVSRRKVTIEKLLPNGQALISHGLQADEAVATNSLRFLSDGMKVSTPTKAQ
ncbi:efflux RND transporter periplasmic adaptor subunit [Bacteroides sp.]